MKSELIKVGKKEEVKVVVEGERMKVEEVVVRG